MSIQNETCLCCGGSLLRHIRQGGVYWFCTSCCQEVPLAVTDQKNSPDTLSARVRPIQPINSQTLTSAVRVAACLDTIVKSDC